MIELSHIHKRFNAHTVNEVYALRDVSVHIKPGEFVTVIGTNGSGKSTLLNMVAGTILPDVGTITLAGKDITSRKEFQRAHSISRVFQNPFMGTAPDMT